MLTDERIDFYPRRVIKRVVGDATHQVLEEPVLAVFGRTRVGLEAQNLLAHEV